MRVVFLTSLALAIAGCSPATPEESRERAYRVMEWRAKMGNDEMASDLVFFRKWLAGDKPGAVRDFRRLAEDGNVHAAAFLGAIYQSNHEGVGRDFEEAARWLGVAAEGGIEDAARDLAAFEAWKAAQPPGASGETDPEPLTPGAR